jgi:hypothetical protein
VATLAIDGVSRRNVWSLILLEVLSFSSEAVDKNSFVQSAIHPERSGQIYFCPLGSALAMPQKSNVHFS